MASATPHRTQRFHALGWGSEKLAPSGTAVELRRVDSTAPEAPTELDVPTPGTLCEWPTPGRRLFVWLDDHTWIRTSEIRRVFRLTNGEVCFVQTENTLYSLQVL